VTAPAESEAIDSEEELDDLARCLDAFAAQRATLGARLFDPVPAISAWSAGQHLYHVALSTDLALRNVAALVRGRGRMIVEEGGPNALAVQVLREGSYPRGESEAPRMVRPGDEVEPEFLTQEMELNREALARTRDLLDSIPAAAGRIPHQHLGELSAAEWLRFARLHARHHLQIVEDLVVAAR